jgi:hypothetical protein
MAQNIPITAAPRIHNMRDRKSRSATCSLFAMIMAWRNVRKIVEGFEKHPTHIRDVFQDGVIELSPVLDFDQKFAG